MSQTVQSGKELIVLLEKHLIPLWEHVGLEHVAVSAATQEEFSTRPLPSQMRISATKPLRPIKRGQKSSTISGAALLFIMKGQADFHLGDYELHCPQGHFLLLRPGVLGQRHQRFGLDEAIFAPQDCRVAWFTTLPETDNVVLWLSEAWEKNSQIRNKKFCLINNSETAEFFRFFAQEILRTPEEYQKTAAASIYTFFILTLRELQESQFHYASRATTPSAAPSSSPIESARQYIGNHLHSRLTIDNVARTVFMSRTNFVRRFTAETGQTFNGYVATMRLKEAARMLKEENWPVQTICEHIGLQPAQFRKRFKETYGVAPRAFRQQD